MAGCYGPGGMSSVNTLCILRILIKDGGFTSFPSLHLSKLSYLKKNFAPEALPWADAFASATAYTGMWLMTKKKVESWYWWIATNIASIPLYFAKQYVFTSVYYLILLLMAVFGLIEWRKRASQYKRSKN